MLGNLKIKVHDYLDRNGWFYKKKDDNSQRVFKKKADSGIRQKIQKFGSFMGGMIMPTIGVFIAWGLWASAFIYNSPTSHGWFVAPELGSLVSIGIKWLLPLLIAINAGKMIYGIRGATIAAFLTIVIIAGTTTVWNDFGAGQTVYEYTESNFKYYAGQPLIESALNDGKKYFIVDTSGYRVMGTWTYDSRIGMNVFNGFAGRDPNQIIGAMIVGPLGAKAFKTIEENYIDSVKPGFEMLIRNFSLAIIAILLGLILFYVWPWIMYGITILITLIIQGMGTNKFVYPVLTIFTEPLRTIFLNNALNYGVMAPLGLNDIAQQQIEGVANPHSLYYLYAGNAGPGLGLLLSFVVWKKGTERANATGASLVEFVGGIHEVYYVYVVQKPIYIISTILGAAASMTVFSFADAGTSTIVSPGSIISVISTSPTPQLIGINIAGVLTGTVVTFLVASLIMYFQKKKNAQSGIQEQTIEFSDEGMTFKTNTNTNTEVVNVVKKEFNWANVKKLIVACDAGMGSSAMAAGIVRKWVKSNNIDIEVSNCALKDLPNDADVIVTTNVFEQFAKDKVPTAFVYPVEKFLDKGAYDKLYENIKNQGVSTIEVSETKLVENKENVATKAVIDPSSKKWIGQISSLFRSYIWFYVMLLAGFVMLIANVVLIDLNTLKYSVSVSYTPIENGNTIVSTTTTSDLNGLVYQWATIAWIIFFVLIVASSIWKIVMMFKKQDVNNVMCSKKYNVIFSSLAILLLAISIALSICLIVLGLFPINSTMFYVFMGLSIASFTGLGTIFYCYFNKNKKMINKVI